ncbi:hypothetical protein SELMODRAFT_425605 [Selaginella moellendorffii]|uniref:TauD/TfdA-like domain-containing protein n=1 Tax=Selaginella moellendorffii TaxID=88036 RepID=D8STN2_SELML|nr:clavaminate synthase-like protein At3g21360 [Selaginella moellendorffii]EFJ12233.1 hypothetical protein SELMODRAFT_425605 [Selaginella moellendorffii]|eukprot:XP_002986670.1 clavaminate synthase-like protein At3g21360 [Selaginella moellendorffii]
MEDQFGKFPVVVVPNPNERELPLDDLISKVQEHKAWIHDKLARNGALLLRGFPVKDAADFDQVIKALDYKTLHNHFGSQDRKHVKGSVYTANDDLPLEIPIGFHNEITYMPVIPDVLVFYCEVAPPQGCGGATGIVRGDAVYEDLSKKFPSFLQDLEDKGAIYCFTVPASEQPKYGSNMNGYKRKQLENGLVKLYLGPCPAIKQLPSGKKAWFNAIGSSYVRDSSEPYVEFGDETAMPTDAIKAACEIMQEKQFAVQWEQGDVLILENSHVLHSRHSTSKLEPTRKILVSMLKY